MRTIAIAGHTGRGKTTLVKQLIEDFGDFTVLAYDPNCEYSDKPYVKFADFLKLCENKRNHIIIFEEATINITNSSRIETIRELLVQKRHNNNVIIFNFHSLRSIPLEIMDLVDFLILFATNDRKDLIYKKYQDDENIIDAFDHINEITNVEEFIGGNKNPDFCQHIKIKRF